MSSVSLDSNKLRSLFGAYYDRRMIRILLLGIISGFPWVLIASALSLWLKEEGLSRSTIGWAGLIFGVYAFNFLWAPIIDRLRLPFLTNKLGHRKSIIMLMQTVILICLIIWSALEPTQNLALIIGVGLAIAISSATQDITIDALRIEQIKKDETSSMAAGAAMAVVGWWTGFKLGGFICLEIAEILQNYGVNNYWQVTFIFLMALILFCNIGLLFIPESNKERFERIISTDQSSINPVSIAKAAYLFFTVGILCFLVGYFFDKSIFRYSVIHLFTLTILFVSAYFCINKFEGKNVALSTIIILMGLWYYAITWFVFVPELDYFITTGFYYTSTILSMTLIPTGIISFLFLTLNQNYGNRKTLMHTVYYVNNVVANPLNSFFNNNGVKIGIAILTFVFLFKIGEAFLGRMSLVFYKEIGFSKGDIAIFSKALGWITTIVFTLIGGAIAMRSGIFKTLIIAGIAMAATNILFSILAWVGPSKSLFAFAVILDDLAAAFATVAFVAFISLLVDRSFTATQYALLASVGTAGRTLLASSSGALVDGLGGDWGLFFIITAVMVVPSLICLMLIKNKIKFNSSN